MKLITPVGLLVTTALLAIYAASAAKVAMIEQSWPLAATAAVSAIASVGTAFMRSWSQYLVYLLTLGFAAKWCWSVYEGYRAGHFVFQFDGSTANVLRSLLSGFTLVVISVICSGMVYRHFHREY